MIRGFLAFVLIWAVAVGVVLLPQAAPQRGVVSLALPDAAVQSGFAVQALRTPSGIPVYWIEDHTVPLLAVSLHFRGGAATVPAAKAGLATLTMGLLEEGAGDRDALAFQAVLEDHGIKLAAEAGRDSVGLGFITLTEHAPLAMGLLRDVLTAPRFDNDAVTRVRAQLETRVARELQSPRGVASRAWYRKAYGDHPYALDPDGTPDSVTSLTRADVQAFARSQLVKDRLVVGLVGAMPAEEALALVDQALAPLPETGDLPEIVPATVVPSDATPEVVPMALPQSVAVFGQQGLSRTDPDWYAASVMNHVLGGGGFTSWLMEEVREKRGLAYYAYSGLRPMLDGAMILGSVGTRNDAMSESLSLVQAQWTRMVEEGPSAQELADAITHMTGAFPLRFDSTGALADILTAMQVYGLGPDYLDQYTGRIRAVTAEDVSRVAQRILDPDTLTIVVVGQPLGLDPEG